MSRSMMTVSIDSSVLDAMRKKIRKGHRSEFVNRAIKERLSGGENTLDMTYRQLAIKLACDADCPDYLKHLIRYEMMKDNTKYAEEHLFYLSDSWTGF